MKSLGVPIYSVCHHIIKVILSYEAIVIEISLFEHLNNFLLAHIFAKIVNDLFEIRYCQLSLHTILLTCRPWSNELNTFKMSARESFSVTLAVASLRNYSKSMPPELLSSNSARIWYTNLFWPVKPRSINACFSSAGSMTPLPSPSKMSKACLISITSYLGSIAVTYSFGSNGFFTCPTAGFAGVAAFFIIL